MSAQISVADIDFTKVGEIGDGLVSILNEIRQGEPIVWNDSLHGWLVTRHEDVNDGFELKVPLSNDRFPPDFFKSIPYEEQKARIPIAMTTPDWIIGIDPPRHTRVRSLARKAFSKKVVEDIRPYARTVIDGVLTEAGARGKVDFVEDVAVAITGRVMARLLGVPERYVENLRRWSWDLNVGLGPARTAPILEQMELSLQEMKGILEIEIAARRVQPTEDFLSQLVTARDSGEGLTDEELLGICYVTLSAGHDTTAHSMTLSFRALLKNKQARRYLVEHPERIGDSIAELMRFVAMATSQPRVAAADFVWHGKQIRKGDYVHLMIAAANRDPKVFTNPEVLDLERSTDRSLVFAGGIHHCIGHLLAKMQLSEFFLEVFKRYPEPELLDDNPKWQPSLAFRGVEHLAVKF